MPDDSRLRRIRALGDTLDGLDVALCAFDDSDRTLAWNSTFFKFFPEHAGHVYVGEPYEANLRRFYTQRLDAQELPNIERYITAGVERHRAQTRPYSFEHRGLRVHVSSLPIDGVGRVRVWRAEALPAQSAPTDMATQASADIHEPGYPSTMVWGFALASSRLQRSQITPHSHSFSICSGVTAWRCTEGFPDRGLCSRICIQARLSSRSRRHCSRSRRKHGAAAAVWTAMSPYYFTGINPNDWADEVTRLGLPLELTARYCIEHDVDAPAVKWLMQGDLVAIAFASVKHQRTKHWALAVGVEGLVVGQSHFPQRILLLDSGGAEPCFHAHNARLHLPDGVLRHHRRQDC